MADSNLRIDSFSFSPDGSVEVAYAEEHRQTERIEHVEIVRVPAEDFEAEVTDALAAIQNLLDAIVVRRRNPPDSFPGRPKHR